MADLEIGTHVDRPVQVRRVRSGGATLAKRQTFLVELAATCNITLAAERAGMHVVTVYRVRARDADFAAAWRDALNAGYERLEAALIRAAQASIAGVTTGAVDGIAAAGKAEAQAPEPLATMTVPQIIDMLTRIRPQREAMAAPGRVHRHADRRPTPEETNAEIMRRIAIVRRKYKAVGADNGQ